MSCAVRDPLRALPVVVRKQRGGPWRTIRTSGSVSVRVLMAARVRARAEPRRVVESSHVPENAAALQHVGADRAKNTGSET